MTTVPIRHILGSDIARWIQKAAKDGLKKRAQACAINAINYLVHAEKIAAISTNVSFFCATHATEEAVASFASACKAAGYDDAKEINLHDHKHKAAVSTFAQLISGHAHEVGLHIAHKPDDDILVARVATDAGVQYGPLGMYLFSFNEDPETLLTPTPSRAFLTSSTIPQKSFPHTRAIRFQRPRPLRDRRGR